MDLNSMEGVVVDVESIYYPLNKGVTIYYNNIVVLKLKKSLELESNPQLSKLNLPLENREYVGSAIISGYGACQRGAAAIRNCTSLRYANVTHPIIPCTPNYSLFSVTHERVFCGKMMPNNYTDRGTCTGDEGGALVMGDTVVGVLSLKSGRCDEVKSHSIYTKVSSYLNFIKNAMKDNVLSTMGVESEFYF
ncbi:snake venom serine protease 5 [Copidosoma floridanum]|uniref:snake venom serine protease 5 n=1 Tax=Copidosoma floridanum TaxID=29053 RepID=UPI0006C96372|nr:snake venom serine protease 5 [Copidosoma floridanum]